MIVGKNWSLHYRELYEPRIKRLTENYNKVYNENQKMKKRLKKHEGSMMSWQEFRARAKIIEQNFAKNLDNPVWANDYQDMQEHWDVQGTLDGQLLKFDVKGMKKVNRWDNKQQDDIAWVEGTNVRGKPGWVKGKADYIVFERTDHWLLVQRQELLEHVESKLKENNFQKGKGVYQIYQREGRLDKITMVPFEDIEKINNVKRINKNAETSI
jgi:hypothetical protein